MKMGIGAGQPDNPIGFCPCLSEVTPILPAGQDRICPDKSALSALWRGLNGWQPNETALRQDAPLEYQVTIGTPKDTHPARLAFGP